MQRITARISMVLLVMAGTGFSETIITALDHADGSDAVLESAVKEVKSVPVDAANVIGDTVQFAVDEAMNAVDGVTSAFSGETPYEKTKHAGELEVDNAWNTAADVVFRSYKVSEEIGELLLIDTSEPSGSVDVSAFFDEVVFAKGESAYYMPKHNSLLVYQTLDNILAIEMALAGYQGAHRDLRDHQVEIETKFVEVSQKTLNELGFRWRFTGKDGGALKIFDDLIFPAGQDILAGGLRTGAMGLGGGGDAGVLALTKSTGSLQWSLFISALEQDDDTDVLSAPRVVTLDGRTATIHVGEKRMMPQSFEINNKDTSAFVEPSDWENEQLGVYMEVTPEIREEGLIDLELHPRVIDIIGYDSYQVMPEYTGNVVPSIEFGQGNTWYANVLDGFVGLPLGPNRPDIYPVGDMPAINASLPYYRVRELETTVTVADGSTVGMGGLIYDKLETFRDKVPVLGSIPFIGRLFRSEGEKSIKRNLMIFVTATQVDVDGRRTADVVLKK